MIAFSLIVFHAIVVPVFPWVGAGRTWSPVGNMPIGLRFVADRAAPGR